MDLKLLIDNERSVGEWAGLMGNMAIYVAMATSLLPDPGHSFSYHGCITKSHSTADE